LLNRPILVSRSILLYLFCLLLMMPQKEKSGDMMRWRSIFLLVRPCTFHMIMWKYICCNAHPLLPYHLENWIVNCCVECFVPKRRTIPNYAVYLYYIHNTHKKRHYDILSQMIDNSIRQFDLMMEKLLHPPRQSVMRSTCGWLYGIDRRVNTCCLDGRTGIGYEQNNVRFFCAISLDVTCLWYVYYSRIQSHCMQFVPLIFYLFRCHWSMV
jgi:hypothetical protein